MQVGAQASHWPKVPSDYDSEELALGVLLRGHRPAGCLELDPALFLDPAHSVIYRAIVDLATAGKPTSPEDVFAEMQRSGAACVLFFVGELGFLKFLATKRAPLVVRLAPTRITGWGLYLCRLRRAARRRERAVLADEIARGERAGKDTSRLISELRRLARRTAL